jgi:hypothetical protein
MSLNTNTTERSSRIVDIINGTLIAGRWILVLVAIALASAILVQAGALPWTLSEVDPTLLVP